MAVGVAVVLIGTRTIPVDPDSVHAPYWVLSVCWARFASCGLFVWGMAAVQHRDEPHRRDAAW